MAEKSKIGVELLHEDIPEEVMGKLRAAYRVSERRASSDCPPPEMVIAYALEELTPEGSIQVQDHLSECRACLALVLASGPPWLRPWQQKRRLRKGDRSSWAPGTG